MTVNHSLTETLFSFGFHGATVLDFLLQLWPHLLGGSFSAIPWILMLLRILSNHSIYSLILWLQITFLCWQPTNLFLDINLVWASYSFIHLPVGHLHLYDSKVHRTPRIPNVSSFSHSYIFPKFILPFAPSVYRGLEWNRFEFKFLWDLESIHLRP